jgi:FkbM family methyltransferase
MINSPNYSPIEDYQQYIQEIYPDFTPDILAQFCPIVKDTNWDQPETALDFNNVAVMALIEAEKTEDLSLRSLNLEIALDAINSGENLENNELCLAHLAIIYNSLGEREKAMSIAFPVFIGLLNKMYNCPHDNILGLVYLPPKREGYNLLCKKTIGTLLQSNNIYRQSILLLTSVLLQAQLVLYNANGLRFLHLANQLIADSISINLQLGIASLVNHKYEGLLYLYKALKLEANNFQSIQSMYLAYRSLENLNIAKFWLETAHQYHRENPQNLGGFWASLPIDSPFTYLVYEDNLLLTVEPSLHSIVTSVLLAQGDWFEQEMELWRSQVQSGMTVIDVGANVGVYTFSAAQKVGASGKVLAIEPFSRCVSCLNETCRINNISWVKVCAGAASSQSGKARLTLNTASELNEIITGDQESNSANFEEISCFTLDSLIEEEELKRVDWLKIDAEGHEMQVLEGSQRLLEQFAPKILYENINGAKKNNIPVAEHLLSKGYKLFRYRPFLQELIPLNSLNELQGNLNIVALPKV